MSPARRRSGWESPACIDELAFYRQSKSLALTSLSVFASVRPRLSSFPAKADPPSKTARSRSVHSDWHPTWRRARDAERPAGCRGLGQFCRPGPKAHDGLVLLRPQHRDSCSSPICFTGPRGAGPKSVVWARVGHDCMLPRQCSGLSGLSESRLSSVGSGY